MSKLYYENLDTALRLHDEYKAAASAALERRLSLLRDALNRGVHTREEYEKLEKTIRAEHNAAWQLN